MNVNLPEKKVKAILGVLRKEVPEIKNVELIVDATSSVLGACTTVITSIFDMYLESNPNQIVVEMLRNMADAIEKGEGGEE